MKSNIKIYSENPIKRGEKLKIYIDGASKGNPGPSAYAYIFVKNNKIIDEGGGYLGEMTNNRAEYYAIIYALEKAIYYTPWVIEVYSDNQLVIKQLNKEYRVKTKYLLELYDRVNSLSRRHENVKFLFVHRKNKFIKIVDEKCNRILTISAGNPYPKGRDES